MRMFPLPSLTIDGPGIILAHSLSDTGTTTKNAGPWKQGCQIENNNIVKFMAGEHIVWLVRSDDGGVHMNKTSFCF